MSGRKKGGLGKGIGALIPNTPSRTGIQEVLLSQIHPDPDQPRKRFDPSALDELGDSIRQNGLLQPILVQVRTEGGYQIIAGERRWQAAQRAGLKRVPILERSVSTQEAFELALLENLQRQDLTAIEEAQSYQRLSKEFKLSISEIALKMSKSESAIKNALRLLKLSPPVLLMIDEGLLSAGHGKILVTLSFDHQETLANQTLEYGWSVRTLESKVAQYKNEENPHEEEIQNSSDHSNLETRQAHINALQTSLTEELQRKVKIKLGKRGGQVILKFSDDDDLKALSEFLGRR